ncbi:O-acetylhomoserine aminocarboxypropyltransferase [Rhodopseudomonas palustris TIE-1]|uniref:O-acetylhomoserine aminocarboxypropyltransferase/cysteine synthase family protein n=1 Tax=Rhodopseudomonas palustris TaxID=1076 RepID=UPI000164AA0D|nr:PLP-dependent transferase [Rhodopseudomonas palustris]ACF01107.1 O-acetylhomoserine aminocarboxypropyltransferase [Rhodopseudomonas palustris TIE-1]
MFAQASTLDDNHAVQPLHPSTFVLRGARGRAGVSRRPSPRIDEGAAAPLQFGNERLDARYRAVSHPVLRELESRLAAFEGGASALAVASGQAASTFSVLNLAQAGDNFVTSTGLYGGTWILFDNTLRELGIEARFVDPSDPENFRRATDARTRLYYAETLPNPKLEVFPIREVAAIGRSLGVPLVMDNTAVPGVVRPLDHGAAIVMYSTTKYIGGHGTTLGGAIIDGGNFPWQQHAERFPLLTAPDAVDPQVVWTDVARPFGPIAFSLRARLKLLGDLGAGMAPIAVSQILQGLETLPIRMEQHNANAIVVADYLKDHPKVAAVHFPGLQSGELRRRADASMRGGYGALIGFELRDGQAAGQRFIEALKLFYHVANIGDARSLAIQPSATTHSQLSEQDQLAAGVTPGFIRLSIGIEHPDDILADLAQALDAA